MATIPLTISGINEAKQQLQDLDAQFNKFKNDPIESKKLAKEFNDLSEQIDKAEKSFDEMNKSGKNLSATFEQIYGDDLKPMTSRIGELEDRLYELANAGQQNTKEFQDMAAEAARLRQNIIETDRQVDLIAENRGLAILGTGFRQVGDSLLRLDFEGAARDAALLNTAFGDLGSRGASAIKGLGKTVVNLGKTFAKMGAALLANPIFLMAAAITAIVAAVVKLLDEMGILKTLMDGVGKVMEFLKGVIDSIVQSLKDFTDWLGITNNAAKDLIEQQIKDSEEIEKRNKKVRQSIEDKYNKEIRLAQVAGEETTHYEIEKQKKLIKSAEIDKKNFEDRLKRLEVLGKASEEDLQKLRDSIEETKRIIKVGYDEIDVLEATRNAEEDKRRDEQLAKDREAYKRRIEEQKKFEQDRLRIARQIQDLELQLQDDGLEKELEQNKIRFDRLIEDLETNEALTTEERIRLKELYREQQFEAEKEIELKYQKELWDALDAAEAEREANKKAQREKELEDQKAFNNALLGASKEYFKQDEEQTMTYAEAKEQLQETLVGSVTSLSNSLTEAGIRNAGLQKTLALVDIATNTAKSLANVIAGATAAATAAGPGAPFVLAGYIASGVATVASAIASAYAALKSAPSIGGSPSGGSPALASATSAQPAQPSFDLFGQNNDLNNLNAPSDNEVSQEIKVKAVVSETEVTETQNKIKKIKDSATL